MCGTNPGNISLERYNSDKKRCEVSLGIENKVVKLLTKGIRSTAMADTDLISPMATKLPTLVDPNIETQQGQSLSTDDFDPAKHLAFVPPSKVHTMKELDFSQDAGVSPIAVSEPFPLFTQEAIQRMRTEIMSSKVWENCQYSSNLAQCQLRGFAAQ